MSPRIKEHTFKNQRQREKDNNFSDMANSWRLALSLIWGDEKT